MKQTWIGLAGLPLLLLNAGCLFSTDSLPGASPEIREIVMRLAESQDRSDNLIAPDLERMDQLLTAAYRGQYEPNPLPEFGDLLAFYMGADLPKHPLNSKSAGAFLARAPQANYDKVLTLAINGPWAEPNAQNYRTYSRSYTEGVPADFLAGTLDQLRAHNEALNTAEQGLLFQFTSENKIRRIRGLKTPRGEAIILWEQMNGEAIRLEGGLSGYLKFLSTLQFLIPIDDSRCWRGSASWSEAGGHFLFFSGTATSGNIGNGIRHEFEELDKYLLSH